MFTKFIIDFKINQFDSISKSSQFENIINGRKGAVLVDYKNKLIPLVRTTGVMSKSAQKFLDIHYDIIENIKKTTGCNNLEFNNVLAEIYDSNYRKMKYHSDQSLDLATDSYICLFSCYNNPFIKNKRKLKIKDKATGQSSEIILDHNSIVLFSVSTNSKFLHKIILEANGNNEQWLGLTFRLSKTFIKFVDNIPYLDFPSEKILRLANEDEKKEFSKCKGLENSNIDYKYPEINYTLSPGDMLPL